MAQVVPFTSAAKPHTEKIMSLSWTPGSSVQLLTTGANTQIKAYPYLRNLLLHVYETGTSGGNLAANGQYLALNSILVSDTNGSGIFGSSTFTGFDAYLVHLLGGYRPTSDPTIVPFYSGASSTFEYCLRVPFEYNPRTGAGALPNMSANATYGLQLYGGTSAQIWQTAPTTIGTVTVDVWMENWTLPDPTDLLGRNQMQGPPLLGTTQYVTKQQYTGLTASSSNTVALTRKGNMIRKWILQTRNSSQALIAVAGAAGTGPGGGALANPFEFWWDGNRLSSLDPQLMRMYDIEGLGPLLQTSSLEVLPTGVTTYDWSKPFGRNWGGDGEGGWLATTQSSRLEFTGGSWGGSSFAELDVITIDVAPIALANQYALDSASGKLLYPAQPEVRG